MPRRPTQSDYNRMHQGATRRMNRLVSDFARGKHDATAFRGKAIDLLAERHSRAAFLGRLRAGNTAPFGEQDTILAQRVMTSQVAFLDHFVEALKTDTYVKDEILQVSAIQNRAEMYVERLLGTANQAFAEYSDSNTLFWWRLSSAEHCGTCSSRGGSSPYRYADLPAWPGDGSSECVTKCKCWLDRDDGRTSFRAA